MIQKFLIFLFIGIGVFTTTIAQKRNIYFLKNNGQEVKLKDSADFIRIINDVDSANTYFKIFEFYPDNSRRFIGQVSSFEPNLVYEGATIRFNEEGKKSEQISYVKGIPYGPAYYFYANGRVKKVLEYGTEEAQLTNTLDGLDNFKVISYYDSTGKELVREGNGYAIVTDTGEMVREEGQFSMGVKDSTWKGFYKDAGRTYVEVYERGKLLSGVQTTHDGIQFTYTKVNEAPAYKNQDIKEFYRFLQLNFRYPREARERGIKGKFPITFMINIDGSIGDIKVSSGPYSIEQEVKRVLNQSGKWTPAKLRGLPVNHTFQTSISLNIG